MKILVVCHGNVNRSPLCAAVLRQHLHLTITECGVNLKLRPGVAAKKMREAAAKYDIDLTSHRSQPLTESLWHGCDTIVYMDQGNLKRLNQFQEDNFLPSKELISLGNFHEPMLPKIQDPAFLSKGDPRMDEIVQEIISASMRLGVQTDSAEA